MGEATGAFEGVARYGECENVRDQLKGDSGEKVGKKTLGLALWNWRQVPLDLLRLFVAFLVLDLGCSDDTVLYGFELFRYVHLGAPISSWNGAPE